MVSALRRHALARPLVALLPHGARTCWQIDGGENMWVLQRRQFTGRGLCVWVGGVVTGDLSRSPSPWWAVVQTWWGKRTARSPKRDGWGGRKIVTPAT